MFLFLVVEEDIMQLVLQWTTDSLLLTNILEGITRTSKEGGGRTSKEAQKEKKMVTIYLETNTVQEPECEKEEEKHTEETD